jgi:hypothetical protein
MTAVAAVILATLASPARADDLDNLDHFRDFDMACEVSADGAPPSHVVDVSVYPRKRKVVWRDGDVIRTAAITQVSAVPEPANDRYGMLLPETEWPWILRFIGWAGGSLSAEPFQSPYGKHPMLMLDSPAAMGGCIEGDAHLAFGEH